MLLTELWGDVLKQREANGQDTGREPTTTQKPTQPQKPQKPLTAQERNELAKKKRGEDAEKRKADMQKRANHNGNRDNEEASEE